MRRDDLLLLQKSVDSTISSNPLAMQDCLHARYTAAIALPFTDMPLVLFLDVYILYILAAASESDLGRSNFEHTFSITESTLTILLSSEDAFSLACSLRTQAIRSALAKLIGFPL
jgi:hypothetical protein